MKKYVKVLLIAVLIVAVICVCAYSYLGPYARIDPDQVQKISAPGGSLNESDTKRFINLYNTAKYRGDDIGYGTTPDRGFTVYFNDERYLRVQEYGNHNFSVFDSCNEKWYFIESKGLFEFLLELEDRSV